MNLSKRVFAYGEKQTDGYTNAELMELLAILDRSGMDITEYFLSEEHMKCFRQSPDEEKLRQIKEIIVREYDKAIRKEIAIRLSKKTGSGQDENILLNEVLKELDRLLYPICMCLLGDESIEAHLAQSLDDCSFFENVSRLFNLQYGKEFLKSKDTGQETAKRLDERGE